MLNQFVGMTDVGFDYSAFEETRRNLIKSVNEVLTNEDKLFLIAFESGEPNWEVSEYDSFKNYPSIQWKQLNIQKLKKSNPAKWQEEIEKFKQVLCHLAFNILSIMAILIFFANSRLKSEFANFFCGDLNQCLPETFNHLSIISYLLTAKWFIITSFFLKVIYSELIIKF